MCLEYNDCLWIFGGEGASPDGYLNEYGDSIFTPLAKEVMFSVSLGVCLSVCKQYYSKISERDCNEILWRGPGW